jgi:hypothetical protein
MGIPILAGDVSTPFTFPSTPPLTSPATMLVGTTKVFIGGKSVMTLAAANTTLGPISISSMLTTKTFLEGSPAHLSGAVAFTSTGWINGTLIGTSPNVFIN